MHTLQNTPLIKIFIIHALNYFRYTQIIPVIMIWTLVVGLVFTTIINLFIQYDQNLLTDFINSVIKFFNIREFNYETRLGQNEIIGIYFFTALIIQIIVSLFKAIFKIKFTFTFYKKVKYSFIISIVGYIFILIFFIPSIQNIIPTFIAWLLTMVVSIYYFAVSSLIDKLIKLINEAKYTSNL